MLNKYSGLNNLLLNFKYPNFIALIFVYYKICYKLKQAFQGLKVNFNEIFLRLAISMKNKKSSHIKYLQVFLFSLWISSSFSQNPVGHYKRADCNIWINADATFKIIYHWDMARSWATGTWSNNKRNILLTFKPIYDTFILKTKEGLIDSLFLSNNFNSERYDENSPKTLNMLDASQSERDCPKKLRLIKNKLYIVSNGRRLKKKIKSGNFINPIDPFFIRD
jgi:hypothetical protein